MQATGEMSRHCRNAVASTSAATAGRYRQVGHACRWLAGLCQEEVGELEALVADPQTLIWLLARSRLCFVAVFDDGSH